VVVVLDLQKKIHPLNNDGVNYSRLAIVNVGGDLFGIMIESFVEILEISRETIKNNTSLLDLSAQRDCFKGVIAISNGSDLSMTLTKNDTRAKADNIIILLDLTKIVSSQDKEVTSVI
jgi:chemotaxis signal transduction protein